MPTITYDSPTSLRNNLDPSASPGGFLGGVLFGQHENDYQNNLRMTEQAKQFGLNEQLNQLQDYQANAPVREAQRNANIATANARTANIGNIMAGQGAEGQVASDPNVIKAKIGDAVLKYQAGLRADQQTALHNDMTKWDALGKIVNDPNANPMDKQLKYQQFSQMNPDMKLPPNPDDPQVKTHALVASSYLDSVEKRNLAKTYAENQGRLDVENKRAAAQVQVAGIREAGANSRNKATLDKESKVSPAQRSTYINHALNNPALLQKEADSMGVDTDTARGMLQDEYKTLKTGDAEAATQKEIANRQFEIYKGLTTADQIRNDTYSRFGLAAPGAAKDVLPPQAAANLKEGIQTTFANGQVWTKIAGQPKRVK